MVQNGVRFVGLSERLLPPQVAIWGRGARRRHLGRSVARVRLGQVRLVVGRFGRLGRTSLLVEGLIARKALHVSGQYDKGYQEGDVQPRIEQECAPGKEVGRRRVEQVEEERPCKGGYGLSTRHEREDLAHLVLTHRLGEQRLDGRDGHGDGRPDDDG